MKFFNKRNVIILSILTIFIVLDQIIKIGVRSTYDTVGPKNFWGNTINYVYVENPGAFLSLGANLPDWARFFIFSVLVSVGLGFVLWHLFKSTEMSKISTHALSLIMAGGIGNLIDRIFRGTVTDFLVMGIGEIRTGVFNLADFIIVIGSLMLVWEQIQISRAKKKNS
ncbi:MAG: signal peptidase II [Bacteriovoracaceae bacterium]|nr:signal peptidase II [Bacteriovoracaceae bacterium]